MNSPKQTPDKPTPGGHSAPVYVSQRDMSGTPAGGSSELQTPVVKPNGYSEPQLVTQNDMKDASLNLGAGIVNAVGDEDPTMDDSGETTRGE